MLITSAGNYWDRNVIRAKNLIHRHYISNSYVSIIPRSSSSAVKAFLFLSAYLMITRFPVDVKDTHMGLHYSIQKWSNHFIIFQATVCKLYELCDHCLQAALWLEISR